jgi:hypothetical protein
MSEHPSIHNVRVATRSKLVSMPWESAQAFLARAVAAYPTTHRLVGQFWAVGVSRPVDLSDADDRTFALAVIEAWLAQIGSDPLPPGISELRDGLRVDASRTP